VGKGIGKVASKYSSALLATVESELGKSEQASGKTPAQEAALRLEELALTLDGSRDLQNALISPMFSEKERIAALGGICDAMGLPEIVKKFLKVVAKRGRLGFLKEIALSFSELADKAASIVVVEVVTARPITNDEQAEISSSLGRMVEGRLEFNWIVDSSILGGMLVRYAGNVLDGTLKSRLGRVERSLLQ